VEARAVETIGEIPFGFSFGKIRECFT